MQTVLPWQDELWEILRQGIAQRRIPHAMLFHGIKGIGKKLLAKRFAQSLLCETRSDNGFACDQCHSCHLFKVKTHPDFFSLAPEADAKIISIGQLRQLMSTLTLTPQFGGYRVVIIDRSECMNTAAANAFLKTLEEPPANTLIILISDRIEMIPATILSRCQKTFFPIPDVDLAKIWLMSQAVKNDDLDVLLAVSQGAPLQALFLGKNEQLASRLKLFEAFGQLTRGQIDPLEMADICSDDPIEQVITWLMTWVIDLTRLGGSLQHPSLFNPDLKSTLQVLRKNLDLKGMFIFYDLLLESKQQYESQVNKQLMLEGLFIRWFQMVSGNR